MRDSYKPQVLRATVEAYTPPTTSFFDTEIPVLPLGLCNNQPIDKKIFPLNHIPEPQDFSEEELREVSSRIWEEPAQAKLCFDFREMEHIYEAFQIYENLVDDSITADIESTLNLFITTLKFYVHLPT